MIRVEVVEQFTLKDYEKIKNSIKRKSIDVLGTVLIGDTFECTKEMVDYLMGGNEYKKVVVKVIEVEPEKTIEERIEDLRKMEVGEPMPKEKFEKLKKEFELKPKKEELGVIPIEKIEETIGGELAIEEVKPKIVVKPKKKKSSKK